MYVNCIYIFFEPRTINDFFVNLRSSVCWHVFPCALACVCLLCDFSPCVTSVHLILTAEKALISFCSLLSFLCNFAPVCKARCFCQHFAEWRGSSTNTFFRVGELKDRSVLSFEWRNRAIFSKVDFTCCNFRRHGSELDCCSETREAGLSTFSNGYFRRPEESGENSVLGTWRQLQCHDARC